MSWNLVRQGDVPGTAWRNGGGVTRELLAWPKPDDWNVRMSVAQVAQDGPFSSFPGVTRWFAVLSGAGVRLRVEDNAHELTVLHPPFAFDGEAETQCELIAGPTEDFNLMLRGRVAHMQRLMGSRSVTGRLGTLLALFSNGAPASIGSGGEQSGIPARTLAWRILDSDETIELTGEDALWMEIEA